MRNSNSKDKPLNQTQNRLMKTQVPQKQKQMMESTQYNPNTATSYKKIDSSKQLPPRSNGEKVNFKIQQNMTQSKIGHAKQGLQLLKKRMIKTGMSRQKSANTNTMQKTTYAPQSLKKITSQNEKSKNLQNYQQQQEYRKPQPKPPSKKIIQTSKQASNEGQKRQTIKRKQPQFNEYTNENQEVPISKNQDFYALLQRQMAKEANQKNMNMSNNNSNNNKKNNVIVDQYGENIQLYQCTKGCGRMFNQNVLPKHEKVCEKVFQSKRKAFNSAAFRQAEVEGDFQKPPQPQTKKLNQTKKVQTGKQKIPKWKLQSAQLRGGLKATKGVKLTAQQQKLQKAQNDMLVCCNSCGRKFNQTVAQRHIPFCQSKAKQMPKFNTTKKK